ncbi:hypothetical protein [Streptomyces sp. NPDC097640]|uniref:hypothetical protein n=1 Tax=Streptomyces sp. NPDC097640 TaxID=3157229 RepID=UPI003322D568
MTDDEYATNALLIKASSLLRDSNERLIDDAETDAVPRLLQEASRCYDAVARKLSADDAQTAATAATVAVGRSAVAAPALQQCVLDELDCDWSWEHESDGPYLGPRCLPPNRHCPPQRCCDSVIREGFPARSAT